MVAVTVVVVFKVLVWAGMVVNMIVELLAIDVWSDVVIGSLSIVVTRPVVAPELVVLVSYVVEVLSHVLIEAISVGIAVKFLVDVNANVSAAVITALKLVILIPT